jgi:FkbM family methyltransferase
MLPPWIQGHYPIDAIAKDPLFTATAIGRSFASEPLGFVDIGARGGVHDLVAPIARHAAVLGFEPDEAACSELNILMASSKTWARARCLPVALSNVDGPGTLHLCAAPTNHSLLPVNTEFADRYRMDKFAQTGSFPLKTQILDAVLFDTLAAEPGWGEFLKIDTQGTEFEILQGASRTLRERTAAIFVEVEFCQIYRQQKLFSDLEFFLRAEGFSFFGFHSTHERSRKALDKKKFIGRERLLHADAVFFKDPLETERRNIGMAARHRYVVFVCALLCGYFDFALELIASAFGSDVGDSDRRKLTELVEKLAAFPPTSAKQAAIALSAEVAARPDAANVSVGRFVDARRAICNFEDVLDR